MDKSIHPGAYHLLGLNGTPVPHTWNAEVLKRFIFSIGITGLEGFTLASKGLLSRGMSLSMR